jgi:putative phage-type endonuclease
MTTFISDLEPLEDIMDTLVFEDEPSIFSEEHAIELIETTFHLIEEYMAEHPTAISEPNFHELLLEEIKEMFYVQMEDHILDNDYIEHDMNDLLEDAFNIYITTFHPERSIEQKNNEEDEDCSEIDTEEITIIENKIKGLREIPQPVQRTPEWYKFRWNLITASNAWKAFESQSTINQLIYEKCQPLKDFNTENDDEEIKMVNTNTTLHWGQKYEPLSVMIYEDMYSSKVEDFGCIQHPVYKFIGASPDGIVIESKTGRYGRMLEIKNIVNREINGIPKKEYWVQMQLQMEVCDLDECDFLETKFVEYPNFETYMSDSSKACYQDNEFNSYVTTLDGNYKGIIVYFHTKEGRPHYEYMPLNKWRPEDVTKWEEQTLHKYESEPYNYTFMRFIYWRLEKLSCVLVLRNKDWFSKNVSQLEKIWNIIEQERVTGYEHRAPVKREKKEQQNKSYTENKEVCFLHLLTFQTPIFTAKK